ncbi:hypothetical protein Peur_066409 [Populus x canadensis]
MVKNCVKMGNFGLGKGIFETGKCSVLDLGDSVFAGNLRLGNAVNREDNEDAARLKVAIAAAAVATNDTVGRVMSLLNYIEGGPVVGFVYGDPEHHFLVIFNHLRLQQ